MKRVKLLIIALISFLVASCGTLIYRATAFSLCGLIGFNSITCNGYFLELDKANALNHSETLDNVVAQYRSSNLSGEWAIESRVHNLGSSCEIINDNGNYYRSKIVLRQSGQKVFTSGEFAEFNRISEGRISGDRISFKSSLYPTEFVGSVSSDGNKLTLNTLCKGRASGYPIYLSRQNPNQAPTSQRPIAQRPSNQLRETKCREDVEFASSSSGVYIKSAIRQIPQNGKCNEKSPTLLASFNSNMSTVQLSIDNQYLMTIVGVNTPQWQIRTASNNEGKENDIAQSLSSSLAINSSLSFSKKTKQLISKTTDANLCYDIKFACDFWKKIDLNGGKYFDEILKSLIQANKDDKFKEKILKLGLKLLVQFTLDSLRNLYSLRCSLYYPNGGYENAWVKQFLSEEGRREKVERYKEKVRCDQLPKQPNVPSSETFRLRLGIGACFDFCKLYINGKLVLETGPGGFPVDGITLPRGTHTARMTIENRPHPKPDAAKGMFSVEGVVNHSKKVYVYQGIPEWTVLPTGIIYDQSKSFSLP